MYYVLLLTGLTSPPGGDTFYGPFHTLAQCEAKAAIISPVEQTAAGPMLNNWAECIGIRDGDPHFAKGIDSWLDLNSVPGATKP
jgi:hypothetical protein